MIIKLHNDGKKKWQSFTAELHDEVRSQFPEATAYGATQEEAIAELKNQVAFKIDKLKGVDLDQEPVLVDYAGKPI